VSLSVIVPTLDEAAEIEATLARARTGDVELIVADGGSRDETVAIASRLADQVVLGERGRAAQMNRGARVARGDILLFLHADTWLPADFPAAMRRAIAGGAIGGRFDVELRGTHPLLPLIARLINLRSRWSRIYTGDQAIFVRREAFEQLGGFPAIPLMEDIAFSAALRRLGPTAALHERVSTSARRWEKSGVIRTVLRMWSFRLAFACGVRPEKLARRYADTR
jgi:rSAM/selenodomain-associated transferase 2